MGSGKEVVYCFNCGVRLLRADFERGTAFRIKSECACNDCLPDLLALLPPKEREAFKKGQAEPEVKTSGPRRGTGRVPVVEKPTRKITSTRIRARTGREEEEEEEGPPRRKPAKGKSKLPLVLVGAGVLVAVLVAILATRKKSGGGAAEEDFVKAGKIPAAKAATPEGGPKTPEDPSRAALQRARDFQAKNPGDYEAQVDLFMEVALKFDKTAAAEEAGKEVQILRDKIAKGMTPEMEKLLGEIKEPREYEEYKKVLEILDKAKDQTAKPAWILQVDKQIDEVKGEAEKKFAEVKQKAEEAKGKGEKEELNKLRERLAKWGIERILEEYDTAFGTSGTAKTDAPKDPSEPARPAGPVRNEEGKAYLDKWMTAVTPATIRDYAAAIGRLEQAAGGLSEDAWKREAADDLRDLKDVETLYKAAVKAAAQSSPGQIVSLEIVTPSGSKETIEGIVTLVEPDHLEIKREGQKEPAFVDPADLSAASLARVAQGAGRTRGSELRAAALMMLLEGEAEAAKKTLVADVPEKYWEYAKTARERAPRLEGGEARRERESKILFWGAGKDFLKMETKGQAIEKYKLLSKDYVGTAIVRKNIELITVRSEAGKEYFLLAADLKGNGAVKAAQNPEVKSCWTCEKDVTDIAEARETFVEIDFHALAGTPYLCWIYAGACCEETFTVYLQATEMTGQNPNKKSEKIPYDVGGPVAWPVEPKVKGLKKTHAQHGGEKKVAKWEWISIPLPKYAAAGLKKIRLMTDQKGFSVAAALVTSLRKAPPKDEELGEEFKRASEEVKSRPKSGGTEAGLVAHWKLDDSSARDFSGQGNNGQVKGGPKSVTGKIGTALEFDGKDDVVEIPGNATLQKLQEGSYTISAWFKPADKPPGRDKDNNASYGIVNKPGFHEGVRYTGDKRFMVEHWLTGADNKHFQVNTATWNETFEPGSWYHVVSVVDVTARTITLYINGKSKGTSKPWDAGAKTRDFGAQPWRIGHAYPGAKEYGWPAKGVIDDVRLFNRALGAQEVQVLHGAGAAGMDQ